MLNFHLTNKAVEDLSEIWDYTYDHWTENRADIYYNMLIKSCVALSINPGLGKKYQEVHDELLGFRAGEHIIFYQKIRPKGVEIIRILHGRMDLKNRI